MVKNGKTSDKPKSDSTTNRLASIHKLIIATPLVIAALFSLAFAQFLSNDNQPVLTNNEEESSQAQELQQLEQLPLVTQPALPVLDQSIEVIAPPLPDSNPESRYQNSGGVNNGVGPSSRDSMKALQGVFNSQAGNRNNGLQGSTGQIKLEDVKL